MTAGESARAKATQLRTKAQELEAWALNWEAGALGEERVAAALTDVDQQTTRVLHDRLQHPSRSKANIDHLVVNASGIYLIDAKNWTGVVTAENGSLRHRWTSATGPQSAVKYGEPRDVRRVAAEVAGVIGRPVTPVLCLANDQADAFGPPQEVDGVHVVPVSALLGWLEQQPPLRQPIDVATVAVDLSCLFPPAGAGSVLPMDDWTVDGTRHAPTADRRRIAPRRRRPSATPPRRSPRRTTSGARVAAVLVGLVGLALFGPKLLGSLTNGIAHEASRALSPAAASKPAAGPTLSPARAQQLDDWRIRARLYAANDKPATLPYVADSYLASQAQMCRTQRSRLAALRSGLLKAPDAQLAAAARRFDTATHDLLHACIANDPVALHHAEGAVTAAASDVNARYNRLIGTDPTAYNATRVV